MRHLIFCCIILISSVFATVSFDVTESQAAGFSLTSPVFRDNGAIPRKYTCQGDDVNPPLVLNDVPRGTKSLALIVDDPDAPHGVWLHWTIWNISPGTKEIAENSTPAGAVQGNNDWGRKIYQGPCPPSGTHRYFFTIYALDAVVNIGPDSSRRDLERAMKGHVLGRANLVGLYRKR